MTPKTVTAIGIALVLAGSTILFFFNPPIKNFEGGVHVFGPYISTTAQGEAEESLLDEAQAYANRSKLFSRIGFGLIAAGSLLQLYSLLCMNTAV